MKYCPITYDAINQWETYSQRGLRLLSPQLKELNPLELSAAEQRREAIARVGKMSIQGVQTKLSARLKIKECRFEIVDQGGHYILKSSSENYPELPENEAITMTLAMKVGLDVPVHGLLYCKDNSMTYFIKRFDRAGHNGKIPVEDFAELSQKNRYTKYDSSMEKVGQLLFDFCSFPKIEALKLFKLTLFNFIVGNEDMHLKNFSLITRGQKISLSPAYDLLNTTIAQPRTKEELALPLNGKNNNLGKRDFIDYYALERLKLNKNSIQAIINEIKQALPEWKRLLDICFLSTTMKEKYIKLLTERCSRLEI